MSQCTATSKQTGNRCGHGAIAGGTVCKWHGGSAPQVLEAARKRLLDMVDPALRELELLVEDSAMDPKTKLAAVKDILDRVGLGATQRVDVSVTDSREDLLREAEEILRGVD